MSSLPLLRPLTIGEILDRAIRIYRSHFVLLISIPLVAFVPMTALQVASQFLWHTTALVDLLQNAFLQVLVSSALVVAVSRTYLAHPPTLKEAYGPLPGIMGPFGVRIFWSGWLLFYRWSVWRAE
jgi:hypothetical protein